MPREVIDPETGAILFKQTEEEKAIDRIEAKVNQIFNEVSYVSRFLHRYEPVFEHLLSQVESKEKPT